MANDTKYMTEQEEARERLKNSVNALTEQISLQAQMQKEPIKMLGGASAVGAVLGLVAGSQFRRTKKIYVDAGSPIKHQKALVRAQQNQNAENRSVGGALVATLGTLAFKTVMDRVVTPRLEEMANGLLERAGQPQSAAPARPSVLAPAPRPAAVVAPSPVPASTSSVAVPVSTGGVSSFLKPTHPGVIPTPESRVEAKAVGTPIPEAEKVNPNAR